MYKIGVDKAKNGEKDESVESVDHMKQMCIKQGYVPEKCTLAGVIVWGLINRPEDPCAGCNENRNVCGGRSADPDYMEKHK